MDKSLLVVKPAFPGLSVIGPSGRTRTSEVRRRVIYSHRPLLLGSPMDKDGARTLSGFTVLAPGDFALHISRIWGHRKVETE